VTGRKRPAYILIIKIGDRHFAKARAVICAFAGKIYPPPDPKTLTFKNYAREQAGKDRKKPVENFCPTP